MKPREKKVTSCQKATAENRKAKTRNQAAGTGHVVPPDANAPNIGKDRNGEQGSACDLT
jgi:hypothetical protein